MLCARNICPVSSPSIEDGFVRLDGGRISEIGPWSECSNQSEAEDLGEVILMPGLVNTHCHWDARIIRTLSELFPGLLVHGLDSGHR